jgi:hypothetical protein
VNDADPVDPAVSRQRYFTLILLRFSGTALVLAGLVINAGRLSWIDREMAGPLGIAVVILGAVILIGVVPSLVRRWRSGGR